jgi:hypothetical protein
MVLGSTLRKECERPNASSLRIALVCSSLVEELRSQSQSRDQLPCPRERMKPAFLCRERMLLVTEFELFECFKKNTHMLFAYAEIHCGHGHGIFILATHPVAKLIRKHVL